MPLLSNRTYHEDTKKCSFVDSTNPYDLQNYDIREDDEITSSDDAGLESSDVGYEDEYEEGSYYISSGPHTADEDPTSASREEKGKRPRSASPFKRSISSLFKRRGSRDSCVEEKEPGTAEDDGSGSATPGVEQAQGDAASSTKFWRSWRSKHQKNGSEHNMDENNNEESEVLAVTKQAAFNDVAVQLRHGSNIEKLSELQIENTSLEIFENGRKDSPDGLFDARKLDESPTSISRGLQLKARIRIDSAGSKGLEKDSDHGTPGCVENGDIMSAKVPFLPSPSTPIDEQVFWKKNVPKSEFQQYESIYQTPKDYVALEDQFDRIQMNKNSRTYRNFVNIIELLGGAPEDTFQIFSLEEFTTAVLELVKTGSKDRRVVPPENHAKLSRASSCDNRPCSELKEQDRSLPRVLKLEEELSLIREKYDCSLEDAYKCRNELKIVKSELEETRHELDNAVNRADKTKSDLKEEIERRTSTEETLREKLDIAAESAKKELSKSEELRDNLITSKNEYGALHAETQVLKEQNETARSRINELVQLVSQLEAEARKAREENGQLQQSFQEKDVLATHAKVANVKLQKDCQRERCKVLDARRELGLLRRQMELAACHKAEALQFMAQMMMSFRDVLSKDTLQECDSYLGAINSNQLFNRALFGTEGEMTEQQLSDQFGQELQRVTEFYRDFAKKRLLDQIFAKHISYMRSNLFLSQQLKGLRQQGQDHEEYISRLLKDCKAQRVLIAKQDNRIENMKKVKQNDTKT
ncbi:LAQU0S03e08196g1_1 [Lachancea quebecensis]|uniref:LAQU0S03e08196g1_1 n=1 Tax=Lachancea quebecensis TaxID=1654605 RepID=A0A0P1KRX6_9SACH|nr:LAQU0S03e08196g1_1 [Lachancea quebecensis]